MIARTLLAGLALMVPRALLAQNVAELQVAPPSLTLKVGERSGLLATAFDRVGNVIPTVRVIWSSNHVRVARVDNDGLVTGIAGGVAIIEARVGARKGQAAVQVIGAPPAPPAPAAPASGGQPSGGARPGGGAPAGVDPLAGQSAGTGLASVLRIEPPTIYLLPSENTRVFPRALKEDGSPAAPLAVTWKSLRPEIASVDQNGVIVALSAGQGTVQVTTSGGLTATAPVVVQPSEIAILEPSPVTLAPGATDTLHVMVPAQGNRMLSPVTMQWSSADTNVARVSLTGVVIAVAPGKTTLSAAGLLQSKGVEVVVHRTVEKLEVIPTNKTEVPLPLEGTAKFQVRALAADGTVVPEASMRWSIGDTSLVGFDPATATLTGKRGGTTTLTVRGPGQGLVFTWNVRVIAANLRLSVSRIGLPPNRRYPLKASFADEAGAVVGPATGVTWSSDNPQVAGVSDDGTVSAVAYGHARVTATAPGGRRSTADVYVQGELVLASARSGRLQLYAVERSSLAQLRKVVEDTVAATEPAFSPDGSRLAYVATRDGHPQIWLMDADGSNPARLTNAPAAHGGPVFTADGQAVVYHAQRTKHQQIFVQAITGSDAIQLTQEPATNWAPAVSPDGETIAFVSKRGGDNDIWLMSKNGANQRAFTRTPRVRESAPAFLRDGSLAYLVEQKQGGRTLTQVVRADLATGRPTPLTATDLPITDFAITPGGDLLALVVNVGKGVSRIYVSPVGSGEPVPLSTTGAEVMVTPAFLP
jgi:uncharacterized protein YjdB